MTPEFIAFLVIAFYMLAAVILLSFGGWLVRYARSAAEKGAGFCPAKSKCGQNWTSAQTA